MMPDLQFRKPALYIFLVCHIWLTRCSIVVDAKEGVSTSKITTPKRLKGRRLSESIYAWRQFESAFAAERKKEDSIDTEKWCEKMANKHGITCVPSAQPSTTPSVSPTVSMSPTLSLAPSVAPSDLPSTVPSISPSNGPTEVPSFIPSKAPTSQPSISPTRLPTASPSINPTGIDFESLQLTRDDGSVWHDNTCQAALPASATQLQTEETKFEYFLYLKPSADPTTSMKEVEQKLATSMAEDVLTCNFDGSNTLEQPFETYGITSLPVDELATGSCPSAALMGGSDCHVVRGGFTPTIFYLNQKGRQRSLYINRSFSSQSQSEIVGVFGPVLQSLLDSNAFVADDVLKTSYSGFLLGGSQGSGTTPVGSGTTPEGTAVFDTTTTVAIQGETGSNRNQNDGTPTGYVVGAVAVCLAAIALIAVSAVLIQRRKGAKQKRDFHLCDDDGQLQLDDEANIDVDAEAQNGKYDTRSVLQEGFPGDNTSYNNNGGEGHIQDVESVYSGKQYSSGRFGQDESSLEARRAVRGLKYSVVNDEATFDESLFDLDSSLGKDPHDYTNCKSATCFKCHSRNMQKPIFVQADLQAIQSDLGSNKKYSPKYDRKYQAEDTVNL